jgi:hypothetical protein
MEHLQDTGARAENPAGLALSTSKYRRLRGSWGYLLERFLRWKGVHLRELTREHLLYGDSRAALVVSVAPLVIASYSDELDGVVLHRFPAWLVKAHGLSVGSRLLAVFCYQEGEQLAPDLEAGPASTGSWANVCPLVAEFLSDDETAIFRRKSEISDAEWAWCAELAARRCERHGLVARRGGIIFHAWPAEPNRSP